MSVFRRDEVNSADVTLYGPGQGGAVIVLVLAGVFSITAVVCASTYYFLFVKRSKTCHRTNLAPYLISLLLANVLQAIGTIMNARWVKDGKVSNSGFCAAQGGIKNAANVGTAIWSFTIALHVFNLLFLRWRTTRTSMIATLVAGWSFVLMIVTLGPYAIATPARGPYFGVSGNWCWITDNYPKEQTFMEYFFEFLSAGLGFMLYALVLLRVRGNLVQIAEDDEDEKERQVGRKQWAVREWRFIWIPRSEAWQLSFSRDLIDSAMLRIAANMVWYPVAYSLLLVPVALARFSTFTGHHVPFWATIFTDFIFNLTGLVNASLLIYTRSVLPDTTTLPHFTTPRPLARPESKTSSVFSFVASSFDGDIASEKARLSLATTADALKHKNKYSFYSSDEQDEKCHGVGADGDDAGSVVRVRRMVSADETTWKKVRTVPLGGVTPFVLPPLVPVPVMPPSSASSVTSPPRTHTRATAPAPAPTRSGRAVDSRTSEAAAEAEGAAKRTSVPSLKMLLLRPSAPYARRSVASSTISTSTSTTSTSSSMPSATSHEATRSSKRGSRKSPPQSLTLSLTVPKPVLPRLRPSPPLMIDTDYYFDGSGGSGTSSRAKDAHVRRSVESFELYDASPTQ